MSSVSSVVNRSSSAAHKNSAPSPGSHIASYRTIVVDGSCSYPGKTTRKSWRSKPAHKAADPTPTIQPRIAQSATVHCPTRRSRRTSIRSHSSPPPVASEPSHLEYTHSASPGAPAELDSYPSAPEKHHEWLRVTPSPNRALSARDRDPLDPIRTDGPPASNPALLCLRQIARDQYTFPIIPWASCSDRQGYSRNRGTRSPQSNQIAGDGAAQFSLTRELYSDLFASVLLSNH